MPDKLGNGYALDTLDPSPDQILSNVQPRRVDLGIGDISWRKKRADQALFDPPRYSPTFLAEWKSPARP